MEQLFAIWNRPGGKMRRPARRGESARFESPPHSLTRRESSLTGERTRKRMKRKKGKLFVHVCVYCISPSLSLSLTLSLFLSRFTYTRDNDGKYRTMIQIASNSRCTARQINQVSPTSLWILTASFPGSQSQSERNETSKKKIAFKCLMNNLKWYVTFWFAYKIILCCNKIFFKC